MSILFEDGRSIEEALGSMSFIYDEAKHPRDRSGRWRRLLGKLSKAGPGQQVLKLRSGHAINTINDGSGFRVYHPNGRYEEHATPEAALAAAGVTQHSADLLRKSPGGERHASVLFAPNRGGGAGLAPGPGSTQVQPDEVLARRRRPPLFAQHRGGGGSGLVPGAGVTRMQPDERRAATRSPGGERSVAGIPHDRSSEGLSSTPEVHDRPHGVKRYVWRYDDFEGPDKSRKFPMAVDVHPGGEVKNAERSHFGGRFSSSGGREFDRSRTGGPTEEQRAAAWDHDTGNTKWGLESGDAADMKRKSDAALVAMADGGHQAASAEVARRKLLMQTSGNYSAREKKMRLAILNRHKAAKKPGSKMSRRQGHDLVIEAVVEAVRQEFL